MGFNKSYSSSVKTCLEETDNKFTFPEGFLLPGKDNVITIVQVKTRTMNSYFNTKNWFVHRITWG